MMLSLASPVPLSAGRSGIEHLNQESTGCQSPRHVEIPILIVGGGPTGLLMAYMLSKLGVQSMLVEKYTERLAAPKAHALCPRSLEICRQFGLDTNEIRKLGSPREDAFWVNFLTNLSGDRIGVLPYERMDADVMDSTPEMIHNVPQPTFEQFITNALASDPNVEVRKGQAFVACHQSGDTVTSVVEEGFTKMKSHIRSRHVVACDGARSQVRQHLGIGSEGEDGYDSMMTIHFNADLRPVVKERVGMLHWIMDPACSGFIIAYDLGATHVLISNFDSVKHPAETWTQEHARATVSAAIGQDIPFEVLSYRPWFLSTKVATEYKRGNVFLVGDAAHSFPPTGGLGLNSGIADAHNLAYKIAAVHHGWASSEVLDSYEGDRRQIALTNSAQSIKNGNKIFSFLKTLGTAGIDDLEEARANLQRSIHDPAKQKMIADEVEGQREHFDNLEIHIGYVYGSKDTPANASNYTPKFETGARLPHAWIRFLNSKTPMNSTGPVNVSYIKEFSTREIMERRYSTLDLCRFDAFTIIAPSQSAWTVNFEEVQRNLAKRSINMNLWVEDVDFEFVDGRHKLLFEKGAHFLCGGALLVRPDQHILDCPLAEMNINDVVALVSNHLGLDTNYSY